MKIIHIFTILILLLVTLCGLLLFHSANQEAAFYVAEGMVIMAIFFIILFYRLVLKPLKAIANGIGLLKSQDFSTHLRHVGQYEADNIIDTFNPLIDELRKRQIQQQEQNHLFNLIVEASPLAIIMVDGDNKITLCNSMASKIFGEQVKSKKLNEIDNRLIKCLAALRLNEHEIVRLSDAEIYRCSRLAFIDNGYPHTFYTVEILTAEVASAERKAYERIIRLMAHEVNNTIGSVNATLDAIKLTFEGDDSANDAVNAIDACREHSSALSSFISRYAEVVKIPKPSLIPADINSVIDSSLILLDSICTKAGVTLRPQIATQPFIAEIDIPMIEQVMINIVKNAIESDGTTYIQISTDSRERTVTVTDNGEGISSDKATHLFSPFFTTKPSGQGLGLTLIRHILRNHNCRFSLTTSPSDNLTRFTINFPK